MVVLNCFGKIKPTCISKKLGLFISNVPEEKSNEWQTELSEELLFSEKVNNLSRKCLSLEPEKNIIKLYVKIFPDKEQPTDVDDSVLSKIAENMICLYFDYKYEDMPLGGMETNCFDGRLCEEDCAEKVLDFLNFLSRKDKESALFPEPVPQWIYSSNHDQVNPYRIFCGGEESGPYIRCLNEWGKLIDNLLVDKADYLLLDYLFNAFHKDNEYNEYHLMKSFSLCQLFLEKDNESELDKKLPLFICDTDSERRELSASYYRKLRNKIAHGDFIAFEELIEEYASVIMDGHFYYDYYEYSRKNWVLLHVCCELDDILIELVHLLFYDRERLERIKNKQ